MSALLEVCHHCEASAAIGSVKASYPEGVPSSMEKAGIWDLYPGETGVQVRWGPAGNSIIRMSVVKAMGLTFDERFGVTGGEDTDFFYRMTLDGGRIVAAPLAEVLETVPAARMETSSLRMRHMRNGHTNAVVNLYRSSRVEKINYRCRSAGKLSFAYPLSILLRPTLPHKAVLYRIRAWSAFGEILEALGYQAPRFYAQPVHNTSGVALTPKNNG